MSARPEMWRARQQRVLTELRKASGKIPDVVAREAGLTYWRYTRFEKGETSLLAEYIPPLAGAYGIEPQALIDALGLSNAPAAQSVDWREDFRIRARAIDMDAERIEAELRACDGRDPPARAVYLDIALESWHQDHESGHTAPKQSKSRSQRAG